MTKTLTALALSAFALCAAAQQPAAPATPAAAATPAVPAIKHNCPKPEYPGRLATTNRMKSFDRELDTYKKCIMGFVDEQRKVAETAMATQKAAVDAGNAAISEYNDHIKALNTAAGTAENSK